jgi:outer membrane immunogenic protein
MASDQLAVRAPCDISRGNMKKAIIAANLAILGAAPALAADLAAQIYRKTPAPIAAVSTWSGLYVGGNVGYGWGNGDTKFSPLPDPASFGTLQPTTLDVRPKGAIGGAQLGYNWQFGSIVTGLETDIQWSGMESSAKRFQFLDFAGTPRPTQDFLAASERLNWFGTVRGRLGVAIAPDLLLYGTGGLAYGRIDASATTNFAAGIQYPANLSTTKAGWTAGVGGEWMFARNWSAKAEYLYLDLGNVLARGSPIPPNPPFAVAYTWKTQENIVRVGVNYHFN